MPVREILQLGHPLLWENSAAVTDPQAEETLVTIQDLADTLDEFRRNYGRGRGIAAPQIGVARRIIYIRLPEGSFDGPMINPAVVWGNNRRLEIWDDCMSFPNLMVRVLRVADIRVAYLDAGGQKRQIEVSGELSELLQHEIDHLDGVLAIQRATGPSAFATRSEWERQYQDRG